MNDRGTVEGDQEGADTSIGWPAAKLLGVKNTLNEPRKNGGNKK